MRKQVVGQQHRLRPLEMRVARQVHPAGGYGSPQQDVLEVEDAFSNVQQFALQPAPHIGGRLIVATSAGVQLRAGGTRQFGDAPLDGGVDVFVAGHELERARAHLAGNAFQRGEDRPSLRRGDDAHVDEAFHMGHRTRNIVGPQPLVERQALRVRHQFRGRPALEATVPQRLSSFDGPATLNGIAHDRPARSRKRAASASPPIDSSATHSNVSSPATVPSSPSMPLRSSADATTCAHPGGVRRITR